MLKKITAAILCAVLTTGLFSVSLWADETADSGEMKETVEQVFEEQTAEIVIDEDIILPANGDGTAENDASEADNGTDTVLPDYDESLKDPEEANAEEPEDDPGEELEEFERLLAPSKPSSAPRITYAGQIVDSMTYRGSTVNAVYGYPYKDSYATDWTYGCFVLVRNFYQNVYGITVSNLLSPSSVPTASKGSFTETRSPRKGDIIRFNNVTHWALVKEVKGTTVTMIQQNAWWEKYTCAQVGVTVDFSDTSVSFFTYSAYLPDDEEPPVISDIKISNLTAEGYTITCNVSDNGGVTRVAFPTWTEKNGQDDIQNPWPEGTIKDGKASYTVRVSDHKNEGGVYITHIYAWDAAGNSVSAEQKVKVSSSVKISSASLKKTSFTYTGKAIATAVTVKAKVNGKTRTLSKDSDYAVTYKNNINVGTATMVIKGKGIYSGTIKKTFKITPVKLSSASVKNKTAVYSGKAVKPDVIVKAKVGGKSVQLKKGTDYTLSWTNNKKVGKAKVTVRGKGNYTGEKTATFTIIPKGTSISKLSAASKAITVKWKKQSAQTDGYQIQYATNKSFTKNKKSVNISGAKKTSKKISGLVAGKTYYFRIRTFKIAGGYYSNWSSIKSIKMMKSTYNYSIKASVLRAFGMSYGALKKVYGGVYSKDWGSSPKMLIETSVGWDFTFNEIHEYKDVEKSIQHNWQECFESTCYAVRGSAASMLGLKKSISVSKIASLISVGTVFKRAGNSTYSKEYYYSPADPGPAGINYIIRIPTVSGTIEIISSDSSTLKPSSSIVIRMPKYYSENVKKVIIGDR